MFPPWQIWCYLYQCRFVFLKLYYIDCLIKELGIEDSTWQPYITLTTHVEEEILEIMGLYCVHFEFPPLYWIPKLHKCPYTHRYIAGSAPRLYKLLTSILSAVKTRLQSYCNTSFSRGGANLMWIMKKKMLKICLST